MAKRKVVVKVSMNGRNQKFSLFPNFRRQDNRVKALQIAMAIPGFQSLSLKGTDRDTIEVTGDGVDAFELTSKLRKSLGYAILETVNEVKEEEKQEEKKPKIDEVPVVSYPWDPSYSSYVVTESQPACCTVM
ncbi:heavy metal-associated isoprenylated plant protein 47 [Eucalyptus grandis]|uniref:HMA domain-containing protein n=3 Tax=Eucalyptus grandis TaxID=71139 RepID=A0A059DDP4_EUCGR|nr:heavy metal-associated isoprenylated plant protein 47 [Eucalyptus grandis]KAK3444596.1 hypothetical protein EUGRSUZ_A00960 [Eucalyptus grandis]KAK3444597.1 hypothetical protein EUGRSUZ_A00960 [Eucalyptus grandis]